MNKNVNKLTNALFREFSPDIGLYNRKTRDRWERLFTSMDTSANIAEGLHHSGFLFQFGARHLHEDDRYEKFRTMIHEIDDTINASSTEDWE